MTNHLGHEPNNLVEPSTSSSHAQPTTSAAVNDGRGASALVSDHDNANYLNGEPSTMYRDAPDVESGIRYTIGDSIILHRGAPSVEP